MAIRVLHVATGNVGRIALAQLIEDPRFELAGLVVSSPEKIGRDAGELAGLDVVTGVAATGDLDEALAVRPECTVYCALGETRLFEALGDVQKILASGKTPQKVAGDFDAFVKKVRAELPKRPVDGAEKADVLKNWLMVGSGRSIGSPS